MSARLGLALLLAIGLASPASAKEEVAVFAGGCFWGVEGVFEHVRGVTDVVAGYAGGSASHASYDRVSSETTGHAEAVRIRFDPDKVSFGQLLQVFFVVAHDPTQLNRQGPDSGPSYRSAIFPQSPQQLAAARAFIASLQGSGAFRGKIVTRLEQGRFYPAERYHQDFMRRNPTYPYILANDVQKVAALKQRYPKLWRP